MSEHLPLKEILLDKTETARLVGLSKDSVDRWSRTGRFPKPLKLGTSQSAPVRWRAGEVLDWISQQEVG